MRCAQETSFRLDAALLDHRLVAQVLVLHVPHEAIWRAVRRRFRPLARKVFAIRLETESHPEGRGRIDRVYRGENHENNIDSGGAARAARLVRRAVVS
jgi:hypothetical protein